MIIFKQITIVTMFFSLNRVVLAGSFHHVGVSRKFFIVRDNKKLSASFITYANTSNTHLNKYTLI